MNPRKAKVIYSDRKLIGGVLRQGREKIVREGNRGNFIDVGNVYILILLVVMLIHTFVRLTNLCT